MAAHDIVNGPVLILGATGMVGRGWCQLVAARGLEHVALSRPLVDLTDPGSIDVALGQPFHLVVNGAAWTDVDGAEVDPEAAVAVNGHAVAQIAQRCREMGSTLVHYSTDYVFSGCAAAPYLVDQARKPISAYGRSKAMGEVALEQAECRYLLVRTSWVYAPWGQNMVRTVLRLAAKARTLRFVDDQRGRPTSAEHLAEATVRLLAAGATGTWHVCDGGDCTWYEFARYIVQQAGLDCRVEPCSSADMPRPAKRPAYSVLDLSRTEALIGSMTHWEANLSSVLNRMESIT